MRQGCPLARTSPTPSVTYKRLLATAIQLTDAATPVGENSIASRIVLATANPTRSHVSKLGLLLLRTPADHNAADAKRTRLSATAPALNIRLRCRSASSVRAGRDEPSSDLTDSPAGWFEGQSRSVPPRPARRAPRRRTTSQITKANGETIRLRRGSCVKTARIPPPNSAKPSAMSQARFRTNSQFLASLSPFGFAVWGSSFFGPRVQRPPRSLGLPPLRLTRGVESQLARLSSLSR